MNAVDAARCQQCGGTGKGAPGEYRGDTIEFPCPAAHVVLVVDGTNVHCDPAKVMRWCEVHDQRMVNYPDTAGQKPRCLYHGAWQCKPLWAVVTVYPEAGA